MADVLLIAALICTLAVAIWFAVRYLLLKRSLRQVERDLRAIAGQLEENRIVRLPRPDRDMEALLGTVNETLDGIRRQGVEYARREAELKAQVESISHDLRTPLTSIQGYLALVDEDALDAETRASLETVERKADALQRLVTQFYELSRLQGEDGPLELERVDAGRLLRESVAGQYRLLAERGLDVRLSAPEHAVWARANADALERVLSNLLHNAGKYATSALEVSVLQTAVEDGRRVLVAFANDADVLDGDQVERLFEPFYTADGSRTQESSGLGLAIARRLLERMGGTIEARLENRDGASWLRFEIALGADASLPSD